MHLRGAHQIPDLAADGRQLGRVHRRDVAVLVEQLFEPRDVAVALGARHRRDQVVDDRGVRAPLRLRALARIVDQERVDQRQVPQHGVGGARRGQRRVLAGQPLHRAVLAEVHHRVSAEAVLQPSIGREVVMARRQIGVVVDRHRVLAESARRLDHQHDVARPQRGEHEVAVVVDEQPSRRRAPLVGHRVAQLRGKVAGPAGVVRRRHRHLRIGDLVGASATARPGRPRR